MFIASSIFYYHFYNNAWIASAVFLASPKTTSQFSFNNKEFQIINLFKKTTSIKYLIHKIITLLLCAQPSLPFILFLYIIISYFLFQLLSLSFFPVCPRRLAPNPQRLKSNQTLLNNAQTSINLPLSNSQRWSKSDNITMSRFSK